MDKGPFKYSLEPLNRRDPFNIKGCFVCGNILKTGYGIRGESRYTSFWLRDGSDNAIFICESELCFNMIILSAEKYRRIPF